jgi:hypothetical protein
MTSTLQTPSTSSNVALEYAVTHNLPKLAKWALEKPESEKPTNIENCLNLALSKLPNEDIISLLVSQLNSPKIEDTNVKESIKEEPKKESKKEESIKEELKEESKKEESIKEDIKEESKEANYPQPLTIITKYVILASDGIEISGDISSLTLQICKDPVKALEELKKGKYSLEELNYQHEGKFMFTILHILCYKVIIGTIYEEIVEYLLTKTDIDINLLSTGGNNAFMSAFNDGITKMSSKILILFLQHPKFNHHFKIGNAYIVNYFVNSFSYSNNFDYVIKLLLECPKTQFNDEHPITKIIKQCFGNDNRHILLRDILKNQNIKFDSIMICRAFLYHSSSTHHSPSQHTYTVLEIIAKSKRASLNLITNKQMYEFISDKNRNLILGVYLEHFPEGIW